MAPALKKSVRQDEEQREVAVILTRRAKKKIPVFDGPEEILLVPYLDVMVNIVLFMLVSMAVAIQLGIINIFPPSSSGAEGAAPQEQAKKSITLTLAVSNSGFTFAYTGGVLPPIPKLANGQYDYDALAQRAVEIKKTNPDERLVIIVPEQNTRYDTLIKVMDTIRKKDGQVLFDDVQLSPGIY